MFHRHARRALLGEFDKIDMREVYRIRSMVTDKFSIGHYSCFEEELDGVGEGLIWYNH